MTIRNDSTKSSEYQVLGPAIESRAPKQTKLVPGMNGPARELELVLGPNQPISLKPETCCSQIIVNTASVYKRVFTTTQSFPHSNRGFLWKQFSLKQPVNQEIQGTHPSPPWRHALITDVKSGTSSTDKTSSLKGGHAKYLACPTHRHTS